MYETVYKVGKLTIAITENNKLSEQALKDLNKILVRLFDENEKKRLKDVTFTQ
jgi:hypothetical protein